MTKATYVTKKGLSIDQKFYPTAISTGLPEHHPSPTVDLILEAATPAQEQAMATILTDQMIFDIRNYANDIDYDLHRARQVARNLGYEYLSWNGAILIVDTDETIFYPPAGFWDVSTLTFVGWKSGYSYSGTNLWLLGDKKVGFKVIPLK
jgi:hypothetical protein